VTSRRVTVVASEILGVPGTGGPGAADSLLAVALARHGHDVELLVTPGREVGVLSDEWDSIYRAAAVDVRPLSPRVGVKPRFLAPTLAVFDALRGDPPDVVIADDWRGLAYAALRSRQLQRGLTDTSFVVHCHGPARVLAEAARKVPDTVARFGEEVAERACIELADEVVSPSAWLLDWMRDHGWPVPGSARVVQYVRESVALGVQPEQVGTTARIRRLAFFGQLREGKGIHLLVDALHQLDPKLLDGVELLFLGRETPRWTAARILDALGADITQVAQVRFETQLERSEALRELLQPGTLAVLPSLLDNSPNTVSECMERGIPFLAAAVGGIPELVAEGDQRRALFEPTSGHLAGALQDALRREEGLPQVRPARAPEESLRTWLELVDSVAPRVGRSGPAAKRVTLIVGGAGSSPHASRLAERTRTVDVEVLVSGSRREGVERASADWVVLLDQDDLLDDDAIDALVAAQAASAADAVTASVRPGDDADSLQLFLGDPGALGLVENHYGVVGLVRRSLIAGQQPLDGAVDPEWPLLARLALSGAKVVSIPDALSEHRGRPGTVADVPGEGLAVLHAFEEHEPSRHFPQLAATLAASLAKLESAPSVPSSRGNVAARALSVARSEGLAGLVRRVRGRLLRISSVD
jgi:glycosyltransferase involved in cell wall biosynthesis